MLKKLCLSLGFLLGVFTSSLALAQVCGDGGQIGTDLDGKTLICFNGTSGTHPYGQHPRDGIGSLPAGGTNTAGSQGGFASAPKVTVVDKFGAVAWNNHGGFDSAFGADSKQQAIEQALARCGKGCKVTDIYANQCVALATGMKSEKISVRVIYYDPEYSIAEKKALAGCRADGGSNCKIWLSECSTLNDSSNKM